MLCLYVGHSVESMTETASDAVRTSFRNRSVTETIVMAVSDVADEDPLDLPPLNTVVDPDALNKMFQPTVGDAPASAQLQFSMAGCEVVVRGDGDVVVTPATAREKSTASVAIRES